ncbi:MAG: hypothetical protein IJ728_05130 [Selenomonadaceae bacterium]|nr:hypothetical protein [Selenomonadaceae bacterium]
MINEKLLTEIDRIIKTTWLKKIKKDFNENYLYNEDSLKCSFYYHLRKKIDKICRENNLRIYSEITFPEIASRADIVIAKISADDKRIYYEDTVALFELKYTGGTNKNTIDWVMNDIKKFKKYFREANLTETQFYFACIYCEECAYLQWITDKRTTNNWANGRVTELDAGYLNGKIEFEINSFNDMNNDLNIFYE